jgi:phosphatidylserine/phosphatidylglycerophosphate/cardiolipin synthase-like enzyme
MYDELIDAGVELFEWPGILHGKSWVKDDDVAAVGSMNLSKSSMARAREIVARVEDPTFAETYAKFHTETRAGAHKVTKDEVGGLALDALGLLTMVGIQF